jgi:hypothetical protein
MTTKNSEERNGKRKKEDGWIKVTERPPWKAAWAMSQEDPLPEQGGQDTC